MLERKSICEADLSSTAADGVTGRVAQPYRVRISAVLLFFTIFAGTASAQILNTGPGLPYVRAAWLDPPGRVRVYAHTRFFTKPSLRPSRGLPQTFVYWDIQGAVGVSYSTPYNLEFTFTPYIYQDTHKGSSKFNLPDDLFLSAKIGTYKKQDEAFNFALALDIRLPLGQYHNLILEPYSAGRFQWGLAGIVSFRPFQGNLPSDAAFHLTMGFTDYGDKGAKLTEAPATVDRIRVSNSSRSVELGFGATLRRGPVSYWFQIFGSHFLVQPPVTAYSREDYFYASPGLSYEFFPGLAMEFALDVRLLRDTDLTDYNTPVWQIPALPNYPGWRFNVGLRAKLPLAATHIKPGSRRRQRESIAAVLDELDHLRWRLDKAKKELRTLRAEVKGLAEALDKARKSRRPVVVLEPGPGHQSNRTDPWSAELSFRNLPRRTRYLILYSIGLANYRTGDYAKARIIFRDLIRLDPESPYADNAAYWMGRSYEKEGRIQEAIDAYVRASNLPDGDRRPYAWINIAACLFKLDRYDEGKQVLRELVKRYPSYRLKPTLTDLLAQLSNVEGQKK